MLVKNCPKLYTFQSKLHMEFKIGWRQSNNCWNRNFIALDKLHPHFTESDGCNRFEMKMRRLSFPHCCHGYHTVGLAPLLRAFWVFETWTHHAITVSSLCVWSFQLLYWLNISVGERSGLQSTFLTWSNVVVILYVCNVFIYLFGWEKLPNMHIKLKGAATKTEAYVAWQSRHKSTSCMFCPWCASYYNGTISQLIILSLNYVSSSQSVTTFFFCVCWQWNQTAW